MSVFVIAEAGVNHNGERDMALALVDAAADAGADAVKFQTFRAEDVTTAEAKKADYQKAATGTDESQIDMIRKLQIGFEDHKVLVERCRERDIAFMSTPFDMQSLRFLVGELGLGTLKIASGEITNGLLLLAAAESGCDVILSTGMSTLNEVEDALGVLAFGLTGGDAPTRGGFGMAFASDAGQAALKKKVTLLHCTTEYPAPFADANLNAMSTMRDAFGLKVGLSDHTPGITAPIAASAMGACLIEKHFTLDRTLPGPDHQASLEPDELKAMVEAIRNIEEALGNGVKKPQPSEIGNLDIVRKSLVTLEPIKAGEPFNEKNLGIKRPGSGISPMRYWDLLGRAAEHDFKADELVKDK
jgi:N-acetylneuraminate synthase